MFLISISLIFNHLFAALPLPELNPTGERGGRSMYPGKTDAPLFDATLVCPDGKIIGDICMSEPDTFLDPNRCPSGTVQGDICMPKP